MTTRAPHTLTRSHKQLHHRAPGTVIDLTCPDCDGRLIGQLVSYGRNIMSADILNPDGQGGYTLPDNYDPQSALDTVQAMHLSDVAKLVDQPQPAEPSPSVDDTAGEYTADALDADLRYALNLAIGHLEVSTGLAKTPTSLGTPAAMKIPNLALVQLLQLLIDQAEDWRDRYVMLSVKASGKSWAEVADALGVTKQAAWKKYRASVTQTPPPER